MGEEDWYHLASTRPNQMRRQRPARGECDDRSLIANEPNRCQIVDWHAVRRRLNLDDGSFLRAWARLARGCRRRMTLRVESERVRHGLPPCSLSILIRSH